MIMSELFPPPVSQQESIFSLNNKLTQNEKFPVESSDISSDTEVLGLKEEGGEQQIKTHRRCWKLEEWGTPQSEELWWIHSVLNGVLLLLVHPAHVDNLSECEKQRWTPRGDEWGQ